MKSKPVLVTLVLGTVMLALLSYFFVKSAQKPGVPSPVKLPAELAALPGKKREPASSRPLGELPLTEQRRALGLRNTRLSEEQGKSRLRVRTRAKGWCYGGDLDAIRLDLQSAPGAPVLLSLEPLEDSGARGLGA